MQDWCSKVKLFKGKSNIRTAIFGFLALVLFCGTGSAFINPSFTPVDIVKQSDLVLLLEFKSVDKDGKAVATIQKVFKGSTKDKEITLNIGAASIDAQGEDFINRIKDGQKQAVFFVGVFQVENVAVEGLGVKAVGFLHFAFKDADWQWAGFKKTEKNSWDMEKTENYLLGTWAGGTDMLARAIDYIIEDPEATVPPVIGSEWGGKIQIGKLTGKVTSLMAVDILDNGKADIFAACESGDRLFRFNGKTYDDITVKTGLNSVSSIYAWGDLNGDGKADMVSWNGKELSVQFQKADGTFDKKVLKTGTALEGGCFSLALLDSGDKARPALLAGTGASPVLIFPQADGSVKTEVLVDGPFPGKDFGEGGRCLAADFDKDGIIDFIQLFSSGALYYKGKGLLKFNPPVSTQIGATKGSSVRLGDFDADGLPDIVVVTGEEKCRLWQNIGEGKFIDMLSLSGEIYYIAKEDGTDVQVGDFNNDGRQDILISYLNISTQLFFNRGFRSFGHGREMDSSLILPESSDGQQKLCVLDANGDGALDTAVVMKNGDFWLFARKVENKALSVTARLSTTGSYTGPLTLTAWRDKRCFGAWTITAGDAGAFVGLPEAGPVTLKWITPDGKSKEKEVIVKDGPVSVIINKLK